MNSSAIIFHYSIFVVNKNMQIFNTICTLGEPCNQVYTQQFSSTKKHAISQFKPIKYLRSSQISSKQSKVSLKTQIKKCKQKYKKTTFQESRSPTFYYNPQMEIIQKNNQQIRDDKANFNRINYSYQIKKNCNKTTINVNNSSCINQFIFPKQIKEPYSEKRVQPIQKSIYTMAQKKTLYASPMFTRSQKSIFKYQRPSFASFTIIQPTIYQQSCQIPKKLHDKNKQSSTQNMDNDTDQLAYSEKHLSLQEQATQKQQKQEFSPSQLINTKQSSKSQEIIKNQLNEYSKECKLIRMTSLDAKFIESQDEDFDSQSDKYSLVQDNNFKDKEGLASPFPSFINSLTNNGANKQFLNRK